MPRPRIAALGWLLVLTAVAAGCGSSSSEPSGGAAGTPPAASGQDSQPATADGGSALDVCDSIDTAAVASILGADVEVEAVPGGGCRYAQSDPRAPSATFDSTTHTAANGGYDAAKSGMTGLIDGTPEDLTGIGDRAVIVVGTSMGGDNQQGGGLVLANGTLTQVTLTQGTGLTVDQVKTMTTDLLALAAGST